MTNFNDYSFMHRLKSWCMFMFLVFITNALFAQKPVQVISSETNQVIGSAHVQFKTQTDHPYKTVICDKYGKAVIPIPAKGGLYLSVYHIGYEKYNTFVNSDESLLIKLQPKDEFLNETVITQQYTKKSAAKAVEKVQIINSKQIANTASVNLADALQTQLAISINQDNSTGSMVSMMGIAGNNVKILIDGVPMIGRLDGNLDLSQINLSDIERIEVIEGPMSVTYGTNALAGVINLITKNPKSKSSISGNLYSEFGAKYNFDFTSNAQIKKWGLKISGGRNFFTGWPEENKNRAQQWKPKEQYFGRAQLNRKIGKTDLRLKSEIFQEIIQDKGTPMAPYREAAFDQYFTTHRFDQSAFIKHQFNKHNALDMIFAYNYYSRDRVKLFKDLVNLTEKKTLLASDHDTSRFTNLVARGTWSQFKKHHRASFQLGYDLNYQKGIGKRILDGEQGFGDYAVFGSMELKPWSHTVVKPGVRFAYNTVYQAPATPMISFRTKLQHFTIRSSYSRGFRAPEIKELYLDFVDVNHNIVGNPDLEAEYSHNYVVSIIKAIYLQKIIIKPEINGFYNAIDNKINLANTTGLNYTYVNLDQFRSVGAKFNLQLRTNTLKASLGMAYINTKNFLDGQEEASNPYLEHNLNIQYEYKKLLFNVFYKFNGSQVTLVANGETDDLSERKTAAYHNLDINIGRSILKKQVSVFVGAKNLMDNTNLNAAVQSSGAHSSGNTSVPIGIGRTYFVKATFNFIHK